MTPPRPGRSSRLTLALAAGLAVFAAGALMAFAWLPQWRAGKPLDPDVYRREFRRLAERAGIPLESGTPVVVLMTDTGEGPYRAFGDGGAAWMEATRTGLLVRVRHPARLPGIANAGQEMRVEFSFDGKPWLISWENPNSPLFRPIGRGRFQSLGDRFGDLLARPGEAPGPPVEGTLTGSSSYRLRNLRAQDPPSRQNIMVGLTPPQSVFAVRAPGPAEANGPGENFRRTLVSGLLALPLVLAVLGLFLTLTLRARIDLLNGAVLAAVALVLSSPRWLFRYLFANPWLTVAGLTLAAPGRALAILLTWSAGESLLRAVQPDFTTSLDTLRRGRLGPRGGRALLVGWAAGAALAGGTLAVYALAAVLPGASPLRAGVTLPVFRLDGSAITEALTLAAGILLAFALASRLLPARWAPWAAALLAGYALGPFQLLPYPLELAANVALAGLLVEVCRRFGLTALLAAALTLFTLPAALFTGLYAAWMPGAFAVLAGASAAVVLLGFVGLARPEAVETVHIQPPAFMRRLAEERRVRHEVDLLARMQLGLLPQDMPRLPGYEIAARSVLASEAGGDLYDFLRDDAGGLWIAAGDVAGHGYSCAVAQAMVKAGLLSLAAPEETPAGVLRRLDKVLRGVAAEHSFTSLALIRLDPATGEARLANAGHPYPFLLTGGRISEVELPGLPLGQGPHWPYADRDFTLPPGAVLTLCSDGLFEATDRNGNPYGFDRAREVLQAMGHRPALEIVDALLNDCRRHLGAEQPLDDVTVVVVKRG
ncbi:MAG: PP2C family protein-serine/threonine phosphatase [Thermoanaerobaculia bacterium]